MENEMENKGFENDNKAKENTSESSKAKIDSAASTLPKKTLTDQLICKSPRDSSTVSTRSTRSNSSAGCNPCFGILQFFLGLLMVIFGILVIIHEASLSQFGSGIWGGCLAMATGLLGLFSARSRFPVLQTFPEGMAKTVYLALSLMCIATSTLILVLAAIGLARDIDRGINRTVIKNEEIYSEVSSHADKIVITLSDKYLGMLFNVVLIIISSLECLVAAISSYKLSKDLWPCFKNNRKKSTENFDIYRSHALVSSWLGKHDSPSQIYVVTGPPSNLGGSKISEISVTPIYALPPPPPLIHPRVLVRYPVMPASLGSVPSPIIPPLPREFRKVHKKYKTKPSNRPREPTPRRSKSRSKSKDRQVTEADVARTYTGLDKTMAEEFIDMCESNKTSLCSDFSSSLSCQSPSISGRNSHSDAASHEYLLNKM